MYGGDFRLGVDLTRQGEATIVASLGVIEAFLALVERAEKTQAFDLPPSVSAAAEVAERRAGKIARPLVFAALRQRFGEVQRRERNEISVLDIPRDGKRVLQQLLGERGILPIERHAAIVVQRNRFTAAVPRLSEKAV